MVFTFLNDVTTRIFVHIAACAKPGGNAVTPSSRCTSPLLSRTIAFRYLFLPHLSLCSLHEPHLLPYGLYPQISILPLFRLGCVILYVAIYPSRACVYVCFCVSSHSSIYCSSFLSFSETASLSQTTSTDRKSIPPNISSKGTPSFYHLYNSFLPIFSSEGATRSRQARNR